ncbi:hypothetical protein ABK040_008679 [Willaertia magna]
MSATAFNIAEFLGDIKILVPNKKEGSLQEKIFNKLKEKAVKVVNRFSYSTVQLIICDSKDDVDDGKAKRIPILSTNYITNLLSITDKSTIINPLSLISLHIKNFEFVGDKVDQVSFIPKLMNILQQQLKYLGISSNTIVKNATTYFSKEGTLNVDNKIASLINSDIYQFEMESGEYLKYKDNKHNYFIKLPNNLTNPQIVLGCLGDKRGSKDNYKLILQDNSINRIYENGNWQVIDISKYTIIDNAIWLMTSVPVVLDIYSNTDTFVYSFSNLFEQIKIVPFSRQKEIKTVGLSTINKSIKKAANELNLKEKSDPEDYTLNELQEIGEQLMNPIKSKRGRTRNAINEIDVGLCYERFVLTSDLANLSDSNIINGEIKLPLYLKIADYGTATPPPDKPIAIVYCSIKNYLNYASQNPNDTDTFEVVDKDGDIYGTKISFKTLRNSFEKITLGGLQFRFDNRANVIVQFINPSTQFTKDLINFFNNLIDNVEYKSKIQLDTIGTTVYNDNQLLFDASSGDNYKLYFNQNPTPNLVSGIEEIKNFVTKHTPTRSYRNVYEDFRKFHLDTKKTRTPNNGLFDNYFSNNVNNKQVDLVNDGHSINRKSQNTIMDGVPAWIVAKTIKYANNTQIINQQIYDNEKQEEKTTKKWEWTHLVAHSIKANFDRDNLVLASKYANTQMMIIEGFTKKRNMINKEITGTKSTYTVESRVPSIGRDVTKNQDIKFSFIVDKIICNSNIVGKLNYKSVIDPFEQRGIPFGAVLFNYAVLQYIQQNSEKQVASVSKSKRDRLSSI